MALKLCFLCTDVPLFSQTVYCICFCLFVVIFRVIASFEATTNSDVFWKCFQSSAVASTPFFVLLLSQCRRRCGSNPLSSCGRATTFMRREYCAESTCLSTAVSHPTWQVRVVITVAEVCQRTNLVTIWSSHQERVQGFP